MKAKGLLSNEMLEKERLVNQFDIDKFEENTNSFLPTVRQSSKVSQIRI